MEQKKFSQDTPNTNTSSTTQSPVSQESSSERKLTQKKIFSALNFTVSQENITVGSFNKEQKKYLIFLDYEQECREVVLDLSLTATVEQAIQESINHFVRCLPLDNHYENYDLYVAKKNGKPKEEFPAFQLDQLMCKTRNTQFSLKCKEKKNVSFVKNSNSIYENTLRSSNPQFIFKKPSEEIDFIRKKPKKNWFMRMLGCGCDQD